MNFDHFVPGELIRESDPWCCYLHWARQGKDCQCHGHCLCPEVPGMHSVRFQRINGTFPFFTPLSLRATTYSKEHPCAAHSSFYRIINPIVLSMGGDCMGYIELWSTVSTKLQLTGSARSRLNCLVYQVLCYPNSYKASQSLLGLTTLAAAFLYSSKCGPLCMVL